MGVYTTIIFELVLVVSSILILFKLRNKLGLAPLYILLGTLQFLQANLGSSFSIQVFDDYIIHPGSIVLFSGVLFGVLLIYIKEGVLSARSLIIGIVISNVILSLMFHITYLQEVMVSKINDTTLNPQSIFKINYKYFFSGTAILFIDFFLLVILYQYLILKLKKIPYLFIITLSLLTVLIFDALAFNLILFYGTPTFKTSLISHVLGKSIAAILYSIILFWYIKFVDDRKGEQAFIANKEREVLSIIKYKKRYEALKVEKEKVEQKLTSQLETTLNTISDGFLSLDTNWCYTYINKKAADFLGKLPQDLIGKNIWNEFPEGLNLPMYKIYTEAAKTQKTIYFEDYHESQKRWFENRVYPSKEGLTVYFTDITEQIKVEKQLEQNKKFTYNIINNIGDPVFVKDANSCLVLVNNAFCQLFNLSRQHVIGKTLAENVAPEERESFLSIDKQVIDSGEENIREETLTLKAGDTRSIITRKTRFVDKEGNRFLIGVIKDITSRKKAEIELEKHKNNLEALVEERTTEIELKNAELQRMNKLFVGRELKMKELKNIIKELKKKHNK
ncbi:PAS domain-containing protein [Seonamhaeicola sp. NFXS20]|uniref:PAS domain-containing protein n=1 Tax=Seonamhaeicola sp. NFXS20 TaxID=2816959 RepID=UPI003B8AE20B